jgi:hypothetical protein
MLKIFTPPGISFDPKGSGFGSFFCEKFKAGRSNHLRKYLPSLTEKIFNSDHLTTGPNTKTLWESLITA